MFSCQYIININIIVRMINPDFSNLAIFRNDGRKATQLRQTKIQLGIDPNVDGSCLFQHGLTQVLCLVRGPYQKQNVNDDLLKIEYTVAPFGSIEKRKIKYDKQFAQFVQNIRKSFEGLIIGDSYSKSQIQVTVTVLQNSGSAKSCVINGITLGLANAGICMKDLLVSCTVANFNGVYLVDTNEEQEYERDNEMVVSYFQGEKKIDCLQLKKAKVREEEVRKIFRLAVSGCQKLYGRLRRSLIQYSHKKMIIF